MDIENLTGYLRYRVIGLLHANVVQSGERLPSIRQISQLLDADHRAVAEAYRRLEAEGLVEIRPGSGVYIAAQERLGPGVEHATATWIAGIFTEGWQRRMPRLDLGGLVQHCATSRLRCACIESVTDHMIALAAELERDFDVLVDQLLIDGKDDDDLINSLSRADFVVSLQFHATDAERLAARAGLPCVIVAINPELTWAVNHILEAGPVVAVVADAAMIRRASAYFAATKHADRIHPVLAGNLASLDDAARPGHTLLATRAARRLLGADEFHLLPEPATFLDVDSARRIFAVISALSLRNLPPAV